MRRTPLALPLALLAACVAPAADPAPTQPSATEPVAVTAAALARSPEPVRPVRDAERPARPATDLEAFAAPFDWPHGEPWAPLLLTHSRVTQSPRRIWFHKDAVTAALAEHAGGAGFEAAPLVYPNGSVFIAEQLDPEGTPFDTEVLITRDGATPEFLLFDRAGARSRAEVPSSCIGCHEGDAFFQPMMSFPSEPDAHRIDVDDTWRDVEVAKHFLEAYFRGDRVFGSYATMWLSKLRADGRSGALSAADRERFEQLRERYGELLVEPR